MFKLIQQRSILNHQIGKKFQRDIAFQFFVARQPYNPHSATAKDFDQPEATKHGLSAASIQRCLEKAAWTASLGRAGRDFGSAVSADADPAVQGCFLWGRTVRTQIHFAADRVLVILTRYSLSTSKKD
jgi:hypothetical protein